VRDRSVSYVVVIIGSAFNVTSRHLELRCAEINSLLNPDRRHGPQSQEIVFVGWPVVPISDTIW